MTQNLTVRLEAETIRKAKVLAAKRSTSISRLVADQIERLVGEDDAYDRSKVAALAELETGFDLGSDGHLAARETLHDR